MGGEDCHIVVIPTARNKCKRKDGDSEEEEDEDDTSEDQGEDDDDDEEEELGGRKGKKAEICEEEVSDGTMLFLEPATEMSVCYSKCQPVHRPRANEIFSSRTTVSTRPAWRSWRNR